MKVMNEMNKASQEKIAREIFGTNGKIFTVTFIKRTTGEKRVLNARLNVKKYLKGGVLKYSPKEHNLISCFDMQSLSYKMIPVDGIMDYRCEGVVITVR